MKRLGKLYAELKENTLAEEWFSKALETSPDDIDIIFNFAKFLKNNQQYSRAFELFYQISDTEMDSLLEVGCMHLQGLGTELNFLKAKECFNQYFSFNYGNFCCWTEDSLSTEEAKKKIRGIILSFNEEQDLCSQNLQNCLLEILLGDIEKAKEFLLEASDLNPDLEESTFYQNMEALLEELGLFVEEECLLLNTENLELVESYSISDNDDFSIINEGSEEIAIPYIEASKNIMGHNDELVPVMELPGEDTGEGPIITSGTDLPETSHTPLLKTKKKKLSRKEKQRLEIEEGQKKFQRKLEKLIESGQFRPIEKVIFEGEVDFVFVSEDVKEDYERVLNGDYNLKDGKKDTLQTRLENLVQCVQEKPYGAQEGSGRPHCVKMDGVKWISRKLTDEHRFLHRNLGKNKEGKYIVLVRQIFNHYDD